MTMTMTRNRWIAAAAVVAVAAVAVFGVWWFVFRDDSPAEVSLERATRSLEQDGTDTEGGDAGAGDAGSDTGLDGSWTVDASIGSFTDFSSSFAGFRVQEQLAGIGAKTAVGRTPDVTGTMRIDGTTIPEASFEVDMTTLTTDDGRRDNALRNQAIQTSQFPTSTFVLTEPIELASVPTENDPITVDATGDLTIHGVTKQVTIPLEAKRNGDVVTVVGQITIPFSDFDIDKPSAATVLSVEDEAVMEIQLFFTRSG